MAERFIAHPPGEQTPDTYRQFVELQRYIERLEERLRPSVALEGVQPLTLTDAWQPLVFGGGVIALSGAGVYVVHLSTLIRGTAGISEFQFRFSTQAGQVTGDIVALGNEFINRTSTVYIESKGGLEIAARGINASIQSGSVAINRVGIAE